MRASLRLRKGRLLMLQVSVGLHQLLSVIYSSHAHAQESCMKGY